MVATFSGTCRSFPHFYTLLAHVLGLCLSLSTTFELLWFFSSSLHLASLQILYSAHQRWFTHHRLSIEISSHEYIWVNVTCICLKAKLLSWVKPHSLNLSVLFLSVPWASAYPSRNCVTLLHPSFRECSCIICCPLSPWGFSLLLNLWLPPAQVILPLWHALACIFTSWISFGHSQPVFLWAALYYISWSRIV